ncbi:MULTISPECIES: hypothetical protein [unclassified Limnobacter]|jgi:hypothetical protein|uniref:hypothetical protein n=1 Tax=unclassified Limnobacter TaxID=2630203 RepID=UPI000CF3DA03|nr:hypothetical protein [Limnobacter sp. SAORIC-690]PQJ25313.1 hypothetical protein BSZ31_10370 [Limnobacter sp. SAORIC-690]
MSNELTEEQRIDVLRNFGAGQINRADAMAALGIDWYGVLIDEMKAHNIPRYVLPQPVRNEMVARTKKLWNGLSI